MMCRVWVLRERGFLLIACTSGLITRGNTVYLSRNQRMCFTEN